MSRQALAEVRQLLAVAADLCWHRSGWTKRAFARDRYGHEVRLDSPAAARFCVAGAVLRAHWQQTGELVEPAASPPLLPADAPPALRAALELLAAPALQLVAGGRLGPEPAVSRAKRRRQRALAKRLTLADVPVVFNDDPRVRFRHIDQLFAICLEARGGLARRQSGRAPDPGERT